MTEEKEESQKSSDKTPEKSNRLSNENQEINVESIGKELKENFKYKKNFSEQDYGDKKGDNIHFPSPENEQDSQKEESNSYRPYRGESEKSLQDKWKRNDTEIERNNKKYEEISDEIDEINKQLNFVGYGKTQRGLNRELKEYKKELHACKQEHDVLDKEQQKISQELERRKKNGNESTEHDQSVSVESLFIENEPIENTVLYVATFFVDLSLSDFKRVVSKFLIGRTVSITKSQPVIEDGKSKIIETQEEKDLVKKWEESIQEAHQADKTLKKCYLKVDRKSEKESERVVGFSLPNLREDFKEYFNQEHAFYIEEQYKRVQELLFDSSENIADNAITILAKAAKDHPNDYGSDWLLTITLLSEEINSVLRFERISKLIFQMQIKLENAQSQPIIKRFLDDLLKQKKDYVFEIIFNLISRQLFLSFLLKERSPSKQLLEWLKQVLDEGEKEQQNEAYRVLNWLIEGTYSYEYIYDILEIIKAWLPEPELPREQYSPSNQAVIFLLVNYCRLTIDKWLSNYPLFQSVRDDSDIDSSLNLLIRLLFHPSDQQELAINYEFTGERKAIQFIGYLIAGWFTILYVLPENKPIRETFKFADSLLRQVIISARKSEQKRLTEFWASLATSYLEKATDPANDKTKKELVFRRKLVKELRNRFNVLQQENLTVG